MPVILGRANTGVKNYLLSPHKSYVEALTPRALECDCLEIGPLKR